MPVRIKATGRRVPIRIIPNFLSKGYRVLRPREEIEKGDFRWSRVKKCYMPITRNNIGDLAGTVHTFIRKEIQ